VHENEVPCNEFESRQQHSSSKNDEAKSALDGQTDIPPSSEHALHENSSRPILPMNGQSLMASSKRDMISVSLEASVSEAPLHKSEGKVIALSRQRSNSLPVFPSDNIFDGSSSPSSSDHSTSGNVPSISTPSQTLPGRLRRGKWTVEEETYVARVIQDFNSGYLNAPAGTTLRTYLSDKLNCDPMRITKKFTGDSCIGKRVFHPAVRCGNNSAVIDKAQVCTCSKNDVPISTRIMA